MVESGALVSSMDGDQMLVLPKLFLHYIQCLADGAFSHSSFVSMIYIAVCSSKCPNDAGLVERLNGL